MTSNSALSKFSELSPEQRQLLFEKIRQKKLAEARRPNFSESTEDTDAHTSSPHQNQLLSQFASSQIHNRVLQIDLISNLGLTQLSNVIDKLFASHPILDCCLKPGAQDFVKAQSSPVVSTSKIQTEQTDQPEWQDLLKQLTELDHSDRCFRVHLVQREENQHALLLIAHPVLLDTYSLLRIANQLLSLLNGSYDTPPSTKDDAPQQSQYANWSRQMLEKKFLRNEWNRVAPKPNPGASFKIYKNTIATHSSWLSNDFIQEHLAPDISTKQWLLEALNGCLGEFFSFNEQSYWLSDPQLKNSEFENLTGFFPYYMPVERHTESQKPTHIGQQFSQLHTRYSSVSEQLANHVCSGAASHIPFVHYHWLDVEDVEGAPLRIEAVKIHGSGLGLSNVEIHITELANGVSVDIHYATECFDPKQVEYLQSRFIAKLKQHTSDRYIQKPSLRQQLESLWKELLQIETVDSSQNFFELGGHSLQVTEMKFRLKQLLKVDIPISVLYELPTIEKLSNYIVATHSQQLVDGMVEFDSEDEQEEGTL